MNIKYILNGFSWTFSMCKCQRITCKLNNMLKYVCDSPAFTQPYNPLENEIQFL